MAMLGRVGAVLDDDKASSAVCHGLAGVALRDAPRRTGTFSGRNLSGFSNPK
jgi:hypothetical protein